MSDRYCEVCRRIIDEERAEALPDTKLCIEHAKAIEKLGGEFKLGIAVETTSKQGSLKKNYGGINVTKSRNSKAMDRLIDEERNKD